MRAMGKSSVSSVLTALLNVGWYGLALGLALTVLLVVLFPFVEVPRLWVTIPVSFSVDGRTYRVTAPSLGIGETQSQYPARRRPIRSRNRRRERHQGSTHPCPRVAEISHAKSSLRRATRYPHRRLPRVVGPGQLRAAFRFAALASRSRRPTRRIRWIAVAVIVGSWRGRRLCFSKTTTP
jgi:hypothetical protein